MTHEKVDMLCELTFIRLSSASMTCFLSVRGGHTFVSRKKSNYQSIMSMTTPVFNQESVKAKNKLYLQSLVYLFHTKYNFSKYYPEVK